MSSASPAMGWTAAGSCTVGLQRVAHSELQQLQTRESPRLMVRISINENKKPSQPRPGNSAMVTTDKGQDDLAFVWWPCACGCIFPRMRGAALVRCALSGEDTHTHPPPSGYSKSKPQVLNCELSHRTLRWGGGALSLASPPVGLWGDVDFGMGPSTISNTVHSYKKPEFLIW